jgi:hypothetical protein
VYRNTHRPELSVYLVNALVPENPEIEVVAQRRDRLQHELRLDYRVGAAAPPAPAWRFAAAATMVGLMTIVLFRRRRRAR